MIQVILGILYIVSGGWLFVNAGQFAHGRGLVTLACLVLVALEIMYSGCILLWDAYQTRRTRRHRRRSAYHWLRRLD